MKTNLFLLTVLLIASFCSCKKEGPALPKQEIRLIDYDTRQPIAGATINCIRDEYQNAVIGTALVPVTHETVHTGGDGAASFNFLDGGYVDIKATGYHMRKMDMRYSKGEIEMLKSAVINVEFIKDNSITDEVTQIYASWMPDIQLPLLIRESFDPSYQTVPYPSGNFTLQFEGIASRENQIEVSITTGSTRVTTSTIVPTPGMENKIQIKY